MNDKYNIDNTSGAFENPNNKAESSDARDQESTENQPDDRQLTDEQGKYMSAMIDRLEAGKADIAATYKEKLPSWALDAPAVRRAIMSQFSYNLSNGFDWINEEMQKLFPLTETEQREAAQHALLDALTYFDDVSRIETIQDEYKFSAEVLKAHDFQEATQAVYNTLVARKNARAEKIKEMFYL